MARLLKRIREEERERRRATQTPLLKRWGKSLGDSLMGLYHRAQRNSPYSTGDERQYTAEEVAFGAAETATVQAVNEAEVYQPETLSVLTDAGIQAVPLDYEVDIPIAGEGGVVGSTSTRIRLRDLVDATRPDGTLDDLQEVGMLGATVTERAAARRRRSRLSDHESRVEEMVASGLQPDVTTTRTKTQGIGAYDQTTTHQALEPIRKRQKLSNWIVGGIVAALIAVPLYVMWSSNLRTQYRAEGFDAGIVHRHQEGLDDISKKALGKAKIRFMDDQDMRLQYQQQEKQNGHNDPQSITNLEEFLGFMRAINPKADKYNKRTIQITEDFQLMCYYGLGMKEIQYDGIPGEKTFALADQILNDPILKEKFLRVKGKFNPSREEVEFEGKTYRVTIPLMARNQIVDQHRGQRGRNLVELATTYNPIIDKLSRDLANGIPKAERTPENIARRNLRFVQASFGYEDDTGDFYRHPMEAIGAKLIDCEDGAVLLMSLNYHRGIDGVLVQTKTQGITFQHLMAGTAGNFGGYGRVERVRGKDFYFSETTEGLQTNHRNGDVTVWNMGIIDYSVDWIANPKVTMWFHTGTPATRANPFFWTEGNGHTYVKRK